MRYILCFFLSLVIRYWMQVTKCTSESLKKGAKKAANWCIIYVSAIVYFLLRFYTFEYQYQFYVYEFSK